MRQIHVTALLALSALALPASTAFAQVISSGGAPPGPTIRSNRGSALWTTRTYPICQGTPGGSRMRENCEIETRRPCERNKSSSISIKLVPALPTRAVRRHYHDRSTSSGTRSRASTARSRSQTARQPRERSRSRCASRTRAARTSRSSSARRGSAATIKTCNSRPTTRSAKTWSSSARACAA